MNKPEDQGKHTYDDDHIGCDNCGTPISFRAPDEYTRRRVSKFDTKNHADPREMYNELNEASSELFMYLQANLIHILWEEQRDLSRVPEAMLSGEVSDTINQFVLEAKAAGGDEKCIGIACPVLQ